MVHLIRDPLDVIVERMHQHQENGRFNDTETGLLAWCAHVDSQFSGSGDGAALLKGDVLDINYKGIPCHSEILRYIQWQSDAIELAKQSHVPTQVLHYEDLTIRAVSTEKAKHTMQNLLDFLEIPASLATTEAVAQSPFVTASSQQPISYRHLYSRNLVASIARFVKALSSPVCWEYVRRYFTAEGSS